MAFIKVVYLKKQELVWANYCPCTVCTFTKYYTIAHLWLLPKACYQVIVAINVAEDSLLKKIDEAVTNFTENYHPPIISYVPKFDLDLDVAFNSDHSKR